MSAVRIEVCPVCHNDIIQKRNCRKCCRTGFLLIPIDEEPGPKASAFQEREREGERKEGSDGL